MACYMADGLCMMHRTHIMLSGGAVLLLVVAAWLLTLLDEPLPVPTRPVLDLSLRPDAQLDPVAEPIDHNQQVWGFWQEAEEVRKEIDAIRTTPDFLVAEAPVPATAVPVTESTSKISAVAFDASGLPYAWAVRADHFEDRDGAIALKDKIDALFLEEGHRAYLSIARDGSLYQVTVGPLLDRAQAVAIQAKLVREGLAPQASLKRFSMLAPSKNP